MDFDFLHSVTFLHGLSSEELHHFSGLLEIREYPADTKIVTEGGSVQAVYIVTEGTVHVRRRAEKREVLLGRIGVAGFFGEVNLFDERAATASIIAMKPVKLASVDYGSLRAFMEAHPTAGYKIVSALMREVCNRLRQTNDRFVNAVYWVQRAE